MLMSAMFTFDLLKGTLNISPLNMIALDFW